MAACLILAIASSASAVVIAGGDGTGNISAPTGDQGWSYVGWIPVGVADTGGVGTGSGVYLGNGWVLTASHVGAGAFTLNGTSYSAIANSSHRLVTDGSTPADLVMFQVNTNPAGGTPLTLSPATLINSSQVLLTATQVTAIGFGRNRGAETFWDANWNPLTQNDPTGHRGFQWESVGAKRWGTNNLTNGTVLDDGHGTTHSLWTVFDDNLDGNEMQIASWDSGGGMFVDINGTWELTGITLAVGNLTGQPGSTAVFGDKSYFADLRSYTGQIQQFMVPEPGTLVLTLTGSIAAWLFWRRRAIA